MCEVGRGEPDRMGWGGARSQLFFIAVVSGVQDSQAKVDMNPDMDAGSRGLCDLKGPSFMWVESSGVPFTLE